MVITGAAGFLGGRTARFLANRFPEKHIVTTSRRETRKVELEGYGCTFLKGDLENEAFCEQLTKNAKTVIHCAGLSSPWGSYAQFYQANYIATKQLIDASIKNGVKRFIFIATPTVYFNYQHRFQVRENQPLPKKMVNHYATTKLMAENYVLSKNSPSFSTIALRPRAIIGAEDTVIFARVLEAYKQGKLKIVGNGENVVDLTCVQNVMEAVVCCMHAKDDALGQTYNITNGEPVKLWPVLNYLLKELGLKPVHKKVPEKMALLVARWMEWKTKLFNSNKEPALTRIGVGILSQNFTLDISKATKQLHYKPTQTTLEGVNEYIRWYKTINAIV